MIRCLVVLSVLAAFWPLMSASAQVTLNAQPQYQEHEPIAITLAGVKPDVPATFWWRPFGKDGAAEPGYRLVDGSKGIHVWAAPGKYEVVCLVTEYTVKWEEKIFVPTQQEVKATFLVGTPKPPPPPVPDGPASKFGMTEQSKAWGGAVAAQYRGLAQQLADNFESIASAIAAGAYATPAAANQELAGRNRQVLGTDTDPKLVAWRPFFFEWANAVTALNKDGRATTVQDYRDLYLETAAGLRGVK